MRRTLVVLLTCALFATVPAVATPAAADHGCIIWDADIGGVHGVCLLNDDGEPEPAPCWPSCG